MKEPETRSRYPYWVVIGRDSSNDRWHLYEFCYSRAAMARAYEAAKLRYGTVHVQIGRHRWSTEEQAAYWSDGTIAYADRPGPDATT